jgi:2'-5' RNA ligase
MRLFTGIDLPVQVKDQLAELLGRLRPTARLKWSTAGNFHVTTKFIGEWPSQRVEELSAALRAVPSPPPIHIAIRGLGWFPNPRAPRVFWAGVEAGPALSDLARDTDRALAKLGVAPETRPFSPHLTLARVKEPVPLDRLRQAVAPLVSEDFGDFVADRFHLYLSELGPSGSVYTKLEEFAFTRS